MTLAPNPFIDHRNPNAEPSHWFHGIPHLTMEEDGAVYWKDRQVECFHTEWAQSEAAKQQARALAQRCQLLESVKIEVDLANTTWLWDSLSF